MIGPLKFVIFSIVIVLVISCNPTGDDNLESIEGKLAGGETTVFISNGQGFGMPSPNLTGERLEKHLDGDLAFENNFVSHPSEILGGLGPVFNNNSCVACHPADGRPAPPVNLDKMSGLFLRISMPGTNKHGGPRPVPGFGTQLQNQAIYGTKKEASFDVHYENIVRTYDDGTQVVLEKPVYTIIDPYIPLPEGVQQSPRIGPPVFGLGLLEAIDEQVVLALADENDSNADGISGKPNYVWDPVSQSIKLGRFGWKAGTPGNLVQSAGAYNEDMGITNYVFPNENSHGQINTDTIFNNHEVSKEELDAVVFYVQTLGVPAARNFGEPKVIRGYNMFTQAKCVACHHPTFVTGYLPGVPEVSGQTIYPYTDMLLHDMGPDLADNLNEFEAKGNEWRTRPLWGIGLTRVVNGHSTFLHDGRAKNIEKAILWHGGEAEESRNAFMKLTKEDREALILFLNSL